MGNLTVKKIEALTPRDKPFRVADGDGLSLEVRPTGAKCWRIRYRHSGKEKVLSPGDFPEVTLAEARERLANARRELRDGIDPLEKNKAAAEASRIADASTFLQVSENWLGEKKKSWAPATLRKAEYVTRRYLQRDLGSLSVATISTPDARRAIAAVAASAPALAEKARGYLGSIIESAIHAGLRDDGRLLSLAGAVPKRQKSHLAAATTPEQVKTVLRAVLAYESPVTQAALVLCMLTAQRPGIVAAMRWAELDLVAAEWIVPAEKMKTRRMHIVPLSRQAVAALNHMRPLSEGREFVFPALARQKTPHLHRDALSSALRRMGLQGEHAAHGFRAMFRTLARERLGIAADVLEAQLAHAKQGEVQKAYDRTQFLSERIEAMQRWADYLDRLRIDAE